MRALLFLIFIAWSVCANAAEVHIALYDLQKGRVSNFSIEIDGVRLLPVEQVGGSSPLPLGSGYHLVAGKLVRSSDGRAFLNADEILAQATVAGADVVVVREDYNSFSTPFRWLVAVAGHPYQISKISVLLVGKGDRVKSFEVAREPYSGGWKALLSSTHVAEPSPK